MHRTSLIPLLLSLIFFSGCASVGYVKPPTPAAGIYHKVARGETLWRISKCYGIDMERIAKANRLPDKRKIYEGQLLFIPGISKQPRLQNPNLLEGEGFAWPVKGDVVSCYGSMEDGIKNKGIDIAAQGNADVVASRSGIISYCDENMKGFGKTIIIDHGDGFSTVYAHNSQLLVTVGQKVAKQSLVAKAGSTGRTKNTILHFEIRKDKEPQNPFYYLP